MRRGSHQTCNRLGRARAFRTELILDWDLKDTICASFESTNVKLRKPSDTKLSPELERFVTSMPSIIFILMVTQNPVPKVYPRLTSVKQEWL